MDEWIFHWHIDDVYEITRYSLHIAEEVHFKTIDAINEESKKQSICKISM